MENNKLLDLRNKQKKKKPVFLRRQGNFKSRLEHKWHRPKGLHNKMRLNKKGNPASVSTGYRSPLRVRGLTFEGYNPVKVYNLSDLLKINTDTDVAVLGSGVGQRKRKELIIKAKELKIKINNVKDIDTYIQSIDQSMKIRKDIRNKKITDKDKKKEEISKKAEQKDAVKKDEESKKDLTPEELEKQEKQQLKEQNKILTKKQ